MAYDVLAIKSQAIENKPINLVLNMSLPFLQNVQKQIASLYLMPNIVDYRNR